MDRAWQEFRAKKLGKVVGSSVYVHASLEKELPESWQQLLNTARAAAGEEATCANVFRIETNSASVSLLSYPAFFEDAFPSLAKAWMVNLRSLAVKETDYSHRSNPPILHRKELLLQKDHERAQEFRRLTEKAEALGLFHDANKIGTKLAWEARLARAGVKIVEHDLTPIDAARSAQQPSESKGEEPIKTFLSSDDEGQSTASATNGHTVLRAASGQGVQRHLTAMQRYSLSSPMQALWRHGFLEGEETIFDYGCGRGDDMRILGESGIAVNGWDPYFAPEREKTPAEVVNLGFVLNVVEDLDERAEALRGAFSLAKKVLAVAVILGGRTAYERHQSFGDGVLTSRGTFQKYFEQSELKNYIQQVLDREPVAVGPGVFFVFSSDEAEQEFLAARQSVWRALPQSRLRPEDRPRSVRPRRLSKWDQHVGLIERYWERCLRLGRMATMSEFAEAADLRDSVGSLKTIFNRLVKQQGAEQLEEAKQGRMADLLVFLALNLFERRRSFKALPDSLKRDITNFFGAYSRAVDQAKALLFSVAEPAVIEQGCVEAFEAGLGYLDSGHSLQVHSSVIPRLSPALRVYVGCASRLYGDVETADLVKIHISSGKLSVMTYEGFDKPLPRLSERVKINLRAQRIDFFEYDETQPEQLLYMKSRFLPPDFEGVEAQRKFDRSLDALQLFDFSDFGPSGESFRAVLETRGYFLRGHQLCRRRGHQE